MRGDVLFFTPTGAFGRLIVAGSQPGRFSHCAIDCGDGTVIEAQLGGIHRNPVHRTPAAIYRLPDNAFATLGLAWLDKQVGRRYGVLDILDQVLRLLHCPVYLALPFSFDCSDLAARYLLECGCGPELGPLIGALHLVSPNSLARQLGVA